MRFFFNDRLEIDIWKLGAIIQANGLAKDVNLTKGQARRIQCSSRRPCRLFRRADRRKNARVILRYIIFIPACVRACLYTGAIIKARDFLVEKRSLIYDMRLCATTLIECCIRIRLTCDEMYRDGIVVYAYKFRCLLSALS